MPVINKTTCLKSNVEIESVFNNGISFSALLPFGWIKAGLLGLMLDIVKAPGFILGALLKLFSPKRFQHKQ